MPKKLTTEEFIEKAKARKPQYGYNKVKYMGSHIKVIVECPVHGDFLISPCHLLSKERKGCPKCSNHWAYDTEEIIKRLKKIYPEYDYSKVNYTGNHTPITIGCPKHGYFLKDAHHLLKGQGCKKCSNENKSIFDPHRSNTEDFIRKAKKIRPEYEYSKVKYINCMTPVKVTCPKHGDFMIRPNNLIPSYPSRKCNGCPKCGLESRSEKRRLPQEEFINRVKKTYPEYDYSKVNYVNSSTKVIIGCPKHGDFKITPNAILFGQGCPICKESKGESKIREKLDTLNIKFIRQYRFKELGCCSYDFYLPNYNLLIEYNGIQHYKEIEFFHRKPGDFQHQLERDQLKKEYAEKNGYKLLVIPYTDFDNIESILEKNILPSA